MTLPPCGDKRSRLRAHPSAGRTISLNSGPKRARCSPARPPIRASAWPSRHPMATGLRPSVSPRSAAATYRASSSLPKGRRRRPATTHRHHARLQLALQPGARRTTRNRRRRRPALLRRTRVRSVADGLRGRSRRLRADRDDRSAYINPGGRGLRLRPGCGGRRAAAGRSGGMVFHGRSFGGALAIMAQVVAPRADYLVAAVPTFGWTDGRRRLATDGSMREVNDYLERRPARKRPCCARLPTSTPSTSPTASGATGARRRRDARRRGAARHRVRHRQPHGAAAAGHGAARQPQRPARRTTLGEFRPPLDGARRFYTWGCAASYLDGAAPQTPGGASGDPFAPRRVRQAAVRALGPPKSRAGGPCNAWGYASIPPA